MRKHGKCTRFCAPPPAADRGTKNKIGVDTTAHNSRSCSLLSMWKRWHGWRRELVPTTVTPIEEPRSLYITPNIIDTTNCSLGLPSPLEGLGLGVEPRRMWGQAHELCSDRTLWYPAFARCAAPMSFPAFRCLHPKNAAALLGHRVHRGKTNMHWKRRKESSRTV